MRCSLPDVRRYELTRMYVDQRIANTLRAAGAKGEDGSAIVLEEFDADIRTRLERSGRVLGRA